MTDYDQNPQDDRNQDDGQDRRPRRRGSGLRAQALRRAREAKQARDARRRQHEVGVEGALADYYAAIAYIEDTRARASRRAARLLAEAEESVQPAMEEADSALRRLRDLGESRETIRELTQASLARLRAALNGEVGDGASAAGGASTGVEASARVSPEIGARHDDRVEGRPIDPVEPVGTVEPIGTVESVNPEGPTGSVSQLGQGHGPSAPRTSDAGPGQAAARGPMGEEPFDWGSHGYPAAS